MAKRRDELNKRVELYGLLWQPHVHPVQRELDCIAHGGQWPKKNGSGLAGMGNLFHFKEAIRLIWGNLVVQHRWFDYFLERWLIHKYVGVMGPKNSGKSADATWAHLIDYYAFPTCTTIIVCSTTKEALEDRIWGEIKKFHRLAQAAVPWIPGHLIEGRMRLITDDREEAADGRDFRNGFVGVPCKKGNQYVGLSDFVGRKNKRMRLLGDEIQFLPSAFIDATANLDGSGGASEFKLTGMGNPSEITNSLGMICEPAAHLGGWDSGIDQTPVTKSWATRFNNGIAIQLPGSDSPNMDVPEGQPVPYPFLITRQQLKDDAARWGTDDWHYLMFDEGRMPRGQGSRRIITRQLCLRGRAMDEPVWRNSNRIQLASLDAAFRAVGGDRCVFTRAEFGLEAAAPLVNPQGELNLTSQESPKTGGRILFALIEQKIIPISAAEAKGAALSIEEAEDQIVKFVMAECQAHNIPPQNFGFDAGMRTSLVAAFARLWSPNVVPIDFGGKPTERKVSREIDVSCRDYYFNFVTELWYSWRMVVDAGQFRGMTEVLMLEGCKREFEKVAGNKIQVEPKEEMKKKTGESPDYADSAVTAIEMARRLGFQISKFEATEQSEKDVTWKREAMDRAKKLWRSGQLNYA